MGDQERTIVIGDALDVAAPRTRRGFLRALGVGGTVVLLPSAFAACKESTSSLAEPRVQNQFLAQQTVTLDLSTDVGIFNYSLIIEQLEQAFYNQLTASANFTTLFPADADREAIVDIRNDENVHRAFITQALGPAALPQLAFDFKDAFASRANVLTNARIFNSAGVAALNGAGQFIKNANNLLLGGKLASVEGRHGATLYDLDDAGNATGAGEPTGLRFADLALFASQGFGAVDANALDDALNPSQVFALTASSGVVKTPLAPRNVPA